MMKILNALLCLFFLASCGELDANIFSYKDDIALGKRLDQEVEAELPILSENDYPEAYQYLKNIREKIRTNDRVDYRGQFSWEVHIIDDDSTLNAFAAPGGYLYFYTGLIKFLDTEDQFAGVLAHEMAHAAERHSTDALTREFGLSIMLDVVVAAIGLESDLDDVIADMAHDLTTLSFSREAESDADQHSVYYLAATEYACDGAAGFFEKLIDEGETGNAPEFLSTHPSPENRVNAINNKVSELGCDTTPSGNDYEAFKAMLP